MPPINVLNLNFYRITTIMNNPYRAYQHQAVLDSNPTKLVVKLYDFIFQASYQKDEKRVRGLLSELIHNLNFDYELSGSLFQIYRYCQQLARDAKFDEIIDVLNPLRESWEVVAHEHIQRQAV